MHKLFAKVWKRHVAKEVGIVFAVLSGISAIALAILVRIYPTDRLDIFISGELQEEGGKRFLELMRAASFFGTQYAAIGTAIVVAGIFFFFSYRREAFFALLTPLAGVVNGFIKIVIDRPRPVSSLVIVYQGLTDPSYPSGHVVFYVVFFGFLIVTMFVLKKVPIFLRIMVVTVSALLIALVSVSRVYLGVHWATDVLGGYFVGYLLLFGLTYFYFKGLDIKKYG